MAHSYIEHKMSFYLGWGEYIEAERIYIYYAKMILAPKIVWWKGQPFCRSGTRLYNLDTFWLSFTRVGPWFICFPPVLEVSTTFIFWRQKYLYT